MLTYKAYLERRWGWIPTLRKAIEEKPVPSDYYGLRSTDDNVFEATKRLMEISVTVSSNASEIRSLASSLGPEDLSRDLDNVVQALRQTISFFSERTEEIQELRKSLLEREVAGSQPKAKSDIE